MTKLILIRHAEARGNVDRIFHGQFDSDITQKGQRQLEYLGKSFKDTDYDAIYSSDLKRAFLTAQSVNHKGLEIIKDKRLREIDGGEWENVPYEILPTNYPEVYRNWSFSMCQTEMPGGETFLQMAERVVTAINEIVRENEGKTVVVATHGTALRAFLCQASGCGYEDIEKIDWCDNTAVSTVIFDDNFKPSVVTAGDDSHLPGDLLTMKRQEWWKRTNSERKVVTVTLNPCVDKTVFLDEFVPCGLNRIKSSQLNYCGKGISVSTALSVLFTHSTATGLLSVKMRGEYKTELAGYGIDNAFIYTDIDTRINTKIIDLKNGTQTELNERGSESTEDDKQRLFQKLQDITDEKTIAVISGSVPPGFTDEDFGKIINIIKSSGAKLAIDSEGTRLKAAVDNGAFIIKPNLFEFNSLLGKNLKSIDEIASEAMKIVERGVRVVIVSMGEGGAVYASRFGLYHVPALKVKVAGLSGAGDSMLAGYIAAYTKGKSFEECITWSAAAAAAAVETSGTNPPLLNKIMDYIKEIKLNKIEL